MAIINCPECGKEISDKSNTCIYCGCPLKAENDNNDVAGEKAQVLTVAEDSKKTGSKKLLLSTIFSFVASLFPLLLALMIVTVRLGTTPKEIEAVITVDAASSTLDKLLDLIPLFIIVFILSFVFALLTYVLKKYRIKQIFAVLSSITNTLSGIIIILFFMTDTHNICFAPVFFIPIALFLISTLYTIIGTKEYMKNA